jgi:3-methyladenine DNA glycosylase AlkD
MLNARQLTEIITDYCMENANESNVIRYSRYFKNGYDAYGLSQPQMENGAKDMLKLAGINLNIVLEAAPELIRSGKYEKTSLILLLVRGFHKQYSREVFQEIARWYSFGIRNWAHADTLGMAILPRFLGNGIVQINDFRTWLNAENKFQRRSVPVTLIKSLKTHEDFPALFAFIECLMSDPEREVHQGTGWFLREAWKVNATVTEKFLSKWKNSAPRLIFQYATEKMTPEKKSEFKRDQRINR